MNNQVSKKSFLTAFAAELGFEPTSDQVDAMKMLASYICEPADIHDLGIFILKGYAGTGKTSLMAALVRALKIFKIKTILLAPTGRAAKVLANYSGYKASTIHRLIYNSDSMEQGASFSLANNRHKDTLFMIDESSMIGIDSGLESNSSFTPRNLLHDLLEYVYSGDNCFLVFSGDSGQLPPVGLEISPALDKEYLTKEFHFKVIQAELNQIVRQGNNSGILDVASELREFEEEIPLLSVNRKDARAISGMDLQEELEHCISRYGRDEVMVVTRSNKRANLFNEQIRRRILWQEEDLNAGDVLMITRNNYFWLEPKSEAGFLANGELAEILKISRREEVYGFEFADVVVRLIDYPDMKDVEVKILIDSIRSEGPTLSRDRMKELFYAIVREDFPYEMDRKTRNRKMFMHPYFQALQVKFGYAVTCHKAQGGQWEAVFIDPGYFTEDMWNKEYMRWLYTAVTRARTQLYLVNFPENFVGSLSD